MMQILKKGNKLSILGFLLCIGLFTSGAASAQSSDWQSYDWRSGNLTGGLWSGAGSTTQTPDGWHPPLLLPESDTGVSSTNVSSTSVSVSSKGSNSKSLYGGKCQGGDIFGTLRCMIANSLRDIRNIVYVVGGIGLITFTFAAIFGKISFKHLANICISLFLLSMMSPFVKFFTGSETALAELEYGLYLSPTDSDVDDANVTGGECKSSTCPSSVDGGEIAASVVTSEALAMPSFSPFASVQNPTGISIPTLTSTTEVDTRTGWQKFKDTIKTVAKEGKKAYDTASTVYSAAKNTYTAVKNTANAVKNADDLEGILMAGTVAANSVVTIAGNATMAAGAVGAYTDQKMLNNINSEIEALRQDSQNNPGNVDANNARIAELQQQARQGTAQAKTEAALGRIVNGANEGRDVLETGIEINNTANAGWRLGGDILSGKGFK